MKEIILIKCGEIALKGLNRSGFEDRLVKNCKRRLESLGKFKCWKAQSTIYIEPQDERQRHILRILFLILKLLRLKQNAATKVFR